MANVLTVPNSGIISFDNRAFSDLSVPPLSASARISYGNAGDVNITSYTTAATALDRFSVDGTQGRLFSVTDVLTGTLFSVNNITGLPILEVRDTDTMVAGRFNTNAMVVSGTLTSLGRLPVATVRLAVSGNTTVTGIVSTVGGTSDNWNSNYTTTNSNSGRWESTYTTTQANTAADSFELAYVGTLPAPLIPIYTVNPLRDALLGASSTQSATLRNGKWISGLSLLGTNSYITDNLISLSSSDIVGIRDSLIFSNLQRLSSISFPSLVSVGGNITLCDGTGPMNIINLNLPSLVNIGGNFTANPTSNNFNIANISLPSLASVGGSFSVVTNTGPMNTLNTLNFPSLATVGRSFSLNSFLGFSSPGSLNSLSAVNFPALTYVGQDFNVNNTGSFASTINNLTTLSFPSLASVVGSFSLGGSSGTMISLTGVNFPSLSSVGGSLSIFIGGQFFYILTTVSLPSLVSIGGALNLGTSFSSSPNFHTLLLGAGLKHINSNITSFTTTLDRHNTWAANTYYPSMTSFSAPASSFSSTPTGITCTVSITNHGLQTGDIITVFGITAASGNSHLYNGGNLTVTRIDANTFSYTIMNAFTTTQLPIGTATIIRIAVNVTPVTKNGRKYICTEAGTSGASEPTWPTTVGSTVTDGTATWTCSEMSFPNILSRVDALNGTNQTITYGANRFINMSSVANIIINSISTAAGVATITTAVAHRLTTGTQVVISGCTGTALRYNGIWTATVTGSTTLTVPVPTDLNGVAGAGTMRLTNASPQYTGNTPIAATAVTSVSSDSHFSFATAQLRDSDSGVGLPVFTAGIYVRNGTTNGFPRYSCAENSWDLWYDTTSKRWVNSPSQFTGTADPNVINNYLNTPQAVNISSTSSANPAVITSSAAHGVTTGAVFTVVIEGCSNTAINGAWTATSTGSTTFTIPVDGSGGATTNSGTVAVLNQTFNQGRLMSSTGSSPIQGVQQTVTTGSNHGFSTGDFVHSYGAIGTHATSITDLNSSSTSKSITTAITVIDATNFRFVRYANTQPFVGSYSLTTFPHLRRPSVNDVAYYTTLKLRARGIAASVAGTTGT